MPESPSRTPRSRTCMYVCVCVCVGVRGRIDRVYTYTCLYVYVRAAHAAGRKFDHLLCVPANFVFPRKLCRGKRETARAIRPLSTLLDGEAFSAGVREFDPSFAYAAAVSLLFDLFLVDLAD